MSIASMSEIVSCVTGVGTDSAKDKAIAPRTLLEYIMNFFSFGGLRDTNERKHDAFIQALTSTLVAEREIPEIMTVNHSGYTITFTSPGKNNEGAQINVQVEKNGKKAQGKIQSSIYKNVCKSLVFRAQHHLPLPSSPLTNEGKIDLRNVNLATTSLANNNLTNMDLSGAQLAKTDLSGANLTGSLLVGTNLYKANLSGANLAGASFSRANLSKTDMDKATLGATDFTEANLQDAKLVAVTGFDTNFSHAKAHNIILNRADLERANFSNANLSRASVVDAKLPNANFRYANLTRARLDKSDLKNASLTNTKMSHTSLKDAILTGTLLEQNKQAPIFTRTPT
ncbi:pentapeptide repeat-containing protein [Candidatus Symbiopectobacterium sp. NZEC151]|uniref:pentapeptide repeat-containing protein n=2 Tax=unclassified Symbiopectobacterium TaxID=2794573 RepID=UPI0022273508|nr:pentapeptide repeat-containing protein [Candidatus Symbiopectobacterium sp. NZEC151]MCW2476132.1 pentapeptide repeat-containing protein [Candidatus Symbiopectobacterium sp. NZEC151]